MATPQHKNPCSGGHKIKNFGRLFVGHHYYTLSLCEPCSELEKKILKKDIDFTQFTQNYLCLAGGGGMKFTISCFLTLQMLYTNMVKIGPVVFKKKMLTHDGRRRQ